MSRGFHFYRAHPGFSRGVRIRADYQEVYFHSLLPIFFARLRIEEQPMAIRPKSLRLLVRAHTGVLVDGA